VAAVVVVVVVVVVTSEAIAARGTADGARSR